LRRAQGLSVANAAVAPSGEGSRVSRRSVLTNATPSERKTWTSLADMGRVEQSRSGANSTRSSIGSIPSIRSDLSSTSHGTISTEESSVEGRRSPSHQREGAEQRHKGWDRSGNISPATSHSMSRSTSNRRSRVLDNNGECGLGLALGTKNGHATTELEERFGQWSSEKPFHSSSQSSLRPFPSSTGIYLSPAHILANTPEVSSDEEGLHGDDNDMVRCTTTSKVTLTTRRITRVSSVVKSFESERGITSRADKRKSMPTFSTPPSSSIRRTSWAPDGNVASSSSTTSTLPRHVKFNQDVEISAGNEEKRESHTLGRHIGRTHSLLNDMDRYKASPSAEFARQLGEKCPVAALDARVDTAAGPQLHAHIRGRRTPCYSAPTSPRFIHQALDFDEKISTRPRKETGMPSSLQASSSASASAPSSAAPSPDLALLSSFSAAQNQMASAGSMAFSHLSVPLKPMIYLTILFSISSFAFMALAGFLVVGYLITAWDDFHYRGKVIQKNISNVKNWCGRLVGGQNAPSEGTSAPSSKQSSSSTHHDHHPNSSPSRIITAPLRMAFAVPATIAYKLTPTSISDSFGLNGESEAGSASDPALSGSSNGRRRNSKDSSSTPQASPSSPHSSIPPRPPLSSLLPSIFLTIFIALGAGIISFFVELRASPAASSTFATAATASRSPSPAGAALPPHTSPRIAPLQDPRRSHALSSQSYHERKPYNIVNV
jgi:hypothetical protein